jgi:hypothetical protein
MQFSIEVLEYTGWEKQPGNTQYDDGHIEGIITSPTGTTYSYDETEKVTMYIPDDKP